MAKTKTISKGCPKCEQQVPVACKACPCGHSFFNARRNSIKSPPSPEGGAMKTRRTNRIKREKPNYYDSLEYDKQTRKSAKLRRAAETGSDSDCRQLNKKKKRKGKGKGKGGSSSGAGDDDDEMEGIEFAVQMTCQQCVNAVQNALSNVVGINNFEVSLTQNTVIVETNLPHTKIQEILDNTGRKAVFKGYGDHGISAVSMFGGDSGFSYGKTVRGAVRFVQTENGCLIDGTIDGLSSGLHGLHIHECGDISLGCQSVGEHYNPTNTIHGGPNDPPSQRHIGDLGNIMANDTGRATFRILDTLLKVYDIIGRSLVITEKADDLGKSDNPLSKINGNSGERLACGIIARSSGLLQNTKQICACDGLTIWDDKVKI